MLFKWFPWRYLIRRWARTHGFLDPVTLLSRLQRFAQPAEVDVPLELLRAGIAFHARGLLNTRVIQQNLDWVWPYWVQRQFDPRDESFLPRGFSVSHVNLTHRNWTAVGAPDCAALPVVDPRGLLTPFYDGWSLDAWIVPEQGEPLLPSRSLQARQRLDHDPQGGPVVCTETSDAGLDLHTRAHVEVADGVPVCTFACRAQAPGPAWLAVLIRPFNPEGISLIEELRLAPGRDGWAVDGLDCVRLSPAAERSLFAAFEDGDLARGFLDRAERTSVSCDVGLATGAALYKLRPGEPREVAARVRLDADAESTPVFPQGRAQPWRDALAGRAQARLPDARHQFLYEAAVDQLVLHTPLDAFPGPYTYKRFWFRDAAFMVHALLCAGLAGRARRVLDRFAHRQTVTGYFESQEGEWDSNGQVLWILGRYAELTGEPPPAAWRRQVIAGARWIVRKRLSSRGKAWHAGLLPAGFSAEHLGNTDYYYWDDFWAVAGLRAAARLCTAWDEAKHAAQFREASEDFLAAIDRSLDRSAHVRAHAGLPASPYRRMDAGGVGSLVVSYPLRLWPAGDERVIATLAYLLENCCVDGAFFQDMIHSGLNPYLTLHMAQALLRAGDSRYKELADAVARLASPTGQWPEAIHPRTGGGCMGDGQHVWASAEWILMMRNRFVREEDDRLVLCSGVPAAWLAPGEALSFGPAPTPYGPVTVHAQATADAVSVAWQADWRDEAPALEVHTPGNAPCLVRDASADRVTRPRAGPVAGDQDKESAR